MADDLLKAKPTPGPYVAGEEGEYFEGYTPIDGLEWGGFIQVVTRMLGNGPDGDPDNVEHANMGQAHLEMVLEAFNVHHETGLTPRQLADALAESEREATRFFEEAETANARMRAWEKHVYIADPFPMLQSVPAGEHGDTPLPIPVPRRVTDLLDALAESERRNNELVDRIEFAKELHKAELLMRDMNRKEGRSDVADIHGDRANGMREILDALASNANPTETHDE